MMAAQQFQHGLRLSVLLADYILLPLQHDPVVTGITLDSRKVQPGDLFIALQGSCADGHEFVDAAIESGAVAIIRDALVRPDVEIRRQIQLIPVPGIRQCAGYIAASFYGNPSTSMQVVGITGTNGKTSCSHFLAQALNEDLPAGVIGTLGNGLYGALQESVNTTPDPVGLQFLLAQFRDEGARYTVMEVSSHGLDQGRVQGVDFDSAVFTNLSRDHLDYHGDMERYGAVKRSLFTMPGLRNAVINADDQFGRELLDSLPEKINICGYTLEGRVDAAAVMVAGEELRLGTTGLQMKVQTPWGNSLVKSPLLGRFNASNLLAVLATLLMLDVPLELAVSRLAQLKAVPGRMESCGGQGRPLVVVDYAHTPEALKQVLIALREHGQQLWCVFGCGGDRDKGKRPLMGAVAEHYADQVMITDDNPRSENPEVIAAEILTGMQESAKATVCHDRATAIAAVIMQASAQDVVLVAGKGHESVQQIGDIKRPFSDRVVVQTALARRSSANG